MRLAVSGVPGRVRAKLDPAASPVLTFIRHTENPSNEALGGNCRRG